MQTFTRYEFLLTILFNRHLNKIFNSTYSISFLTWALKMFTRNPRYSFCPQQILMIRSKNGKIPPSVRIVICY